MSNFSLKSILLFLFFLALPVFVFGWIIFGREEPTFQSALTPFQEAGKQAQEDLTSLPAQAFTEDKENFHLVDTTPTGMDIRFAGEEKPTLTDEEKKAEIDKAFTLTFPKDYSKPLEVKLDDKRSIMVTDLGGSSSYTGTLLTDAPIEAPSLSFPLSPQENLFQKFYNNIFPKKAEAAPAKYLTYTDQDKRKLISYVYQKDQASGEKKLKQWVLYREGNGQEQESYSFQNAKLKKNEDGSINGYFFGDQDLKNQTAKDSVEPSLLERAQKVLSKEMGEDILNSNKTPDFTIPRPYIIDNQGNRTDFDWKVTGDGTTISVLIDLLSLISHPSSLYPIALDPTLSFTAPGDPQGGMAITGEAANNYFSILAAGDFNADGKTDLAVGANGYSSSTGRVYIFFNDGSYTTAASSADVVLTGGATNNSFGGSLASGDFNADGKTDLAVGAYGYSTSTGRTYIFYNDGAYPAGAATADVILTGETGSLFGISLASGDFNADGKTDLAVGAFFYSSATGRAYIFYNDGSYPAGASTADVTLTGGAASDYFGISLAAGDFNADGRTDLAVGAYFYPSLSLTGRAYIFYNDGSYPAGAATADVTLTGEASSAFGISLAAGDFNADGKTDLVVGAYAYSTNTGRVYIFYNDGAYPAGATSADVTLTGGATNDYFGNSLAAGDFNADSKTDLAVGANGYSTSTGRVYIFYNDGAIPTTAATADVIITGETTSNSFGSPLISGDFNADGKTDLAVGANGFASNTGKTYIFYSQNGVVNTNQNLTGEASSSFGASLASGDFNTDGKTDLAVGAHIYSSQTGRAYIFYNDGSIPTTAATADVIITGEAASNYFGYSLSSGDFNADGKTDLAVGALLYSSFAGRAYIFYNDGSIPTTAATADVIITGEASSNFSNSLTSGDFNADGKTDLAVGATYVFSGVSGRAYIFYNDGSIPTTAATADVIITAETITNEFGIALAAGDWNADGRTDLAVGADRYSTDTGRVYIFYNDGSIPTTAATADVIITGESTADYFGVALVSGDINSDGKTDLVVGGWSAPTGGRTYLFYNDGSIPTTAATADVIITGEAAVGFGRALTVGDFNADGRTDLAIKDDGYSTNTGRIYLFYNDGSIPTTAATADVIISGETTSNYFGFSLAAGDFNADGTTDLAVGAYGYSTSTGRVYIYQGQGNYAWNVQALPPSASVRSNLQGAGQEMQITGQTASDSFGYSLASGDFNADGKTDLAVGAPVYSTSTGRVYIFYNDGSITPAASSADVTLTGGATGDQFGISLASGDWNADGKTDLAVGARSYSSAAGRAYIFYNDGAYPAGASTADVTLTGEASSYFGVSLAAGDFNADGTTDLVAGAWAYSSLSGRAYIFYNDGAYPAGAATADVTITGNIAHDYFGYSLAAGDFNFDGRTDLAIGGPQASGTFSYGGIVGIFYNDGSYPTTSSTADVLIQGSATFNEIGSALVAGDFNADGRTDLAAGAAVYSTNTGRAYIFYNDGSIPTTADTADVILTGGATSDNFGTSLVSGDFNTDGKTDLAVGATGYSTSTGRVYIFYNDGAYPAGAATADVTLTGETTNNYFGAALASGDFNNDGKADLAVGAYGNASSRGKVYMYTFNDPVITGETTSNYFGYSLAVGDFNADSKIDLAVGAYGYSSSTGRAYIFYNDGAYTAAASSADVVLTGEADSFFGFSLTSGDFNTDGRTDLAVGAWSAAFGDGKVFIFYNDGVYPAGAATADVSIVGSSSFGSFGYSLASGDFNADGKTDLVANAPDYSASTGRAYIFYNDGSIPTTSGTADVIITGGASINFFGWTLASGDFNADGKTDLAVGAYGYSTYTGRAYLFYNDGSIPTTAATADVILTGETTHNYFGDSLVAGDFNADRTTDLAVGADGYSSSTGRAYIFYNDGSYPAGAATADVTLTGEASSGFGASLTSGDFNADGRTDLAVGAYGYSSSTGRAYIFYNDGSIPTMAVTADVTLTGGATSDYFGISLASGDFNADDKTDLAVGARGYSTSTGRAYVFMTEVKLAGNFDTGRLKGTGKLKGTAKFK